MVYCRNAFYSCTFAFLFCQLARKKSRANGVYPDVGRYSGRHCPTIQLPVQGSGFPTILNAWKKENWRQPCLIENQDLHLVELTLTMASLISDECHMALYDIYGSDYEKLNKEEQLVLATAFSEGNTSNYRMQQLLGKNSLGVGKTLYALVGKDMLVPVNKGRWTSYSLNSEYMEREKSRSKVKE